MDHRGVIGRQLERDGRTGGVPDNMSASRAQVGQQRLCVGCMLRETDCRRVAGTPGLAPLVVPDEPVPARQGGGGHERPEAASDWAIGNQQHRFARSFDLVLQLRAVDIHLVHFKSSRGVCARAMAQPAGLRLRPRRLLSTA